MQNNEKNVTIYICKIFRLFMKNKLISFENKFGSNILVIYIIIYLMNKIKYNKLLLIICLKLKLNGLMVFKLL